jgi:hypothetical protein
LRSWTSSFIAAAVEAHGGQITLEKPVIHAVGALVRFLDPEGNDIGVMTYETTPHTEPPLAPALVRCRGFRTFVVGALVGCGDELLA